MPVLKADDAPVLQVREGVQRRMIHTNDLMMAIIDFDGGPWPTPEVPHQHVHEQVTYVVSGEVIFFCEGEPDQHLIAGDMFSVPSGKLHGIQLLSERARLIDSFNPIRKDFLPK